MKTYIKSWFKIVGVQILWAFEDKNLNEKNKNLSTQIDELGK